MIGFRFVDDHQADYRVTDLCRVAGVSRSSYYAWRSRPLSARAVADGELLESIREIHLNSRGTYGAPRIRGQLRRKGHHVSRHRVARLMRADGLVGAHGRRKWRKGRHPAMVPAPDLLQRDFTAERSDLRWVADISEFGCCDGKLYLAGIRDLHDHTLVGWSMGERQTTDLVVAALVMALGRRNPTGELLHHADPRSPIHVSGVHQPARGLGTRRLLRQRRRLLRQCRDGGLLGHAEEGDPPHPGPDRDLHPLGDAHDPVRLHRDLLQPLTPPGRPR